MYYNIDNIYSKDLYRFWEKNFMEIPAPLGCSRPIFSQIHREWSKKEKKKNTVIF